ncbi:MAG: TonB-dependent receptor [Gemmatimonadetes bacterium]|nr:TonB-dependent receptor [Gemmatimonadota bacterium]
MAFSGLAAQPAEAQTGPFDVRGVVTDPEGNGLQGAMVVALALPDSVLTKYALSGGDGGFTLSRVPVGEYLLQVTFIGYSLFREGLSVTNADVDAGTLNLSLAPVGMDTLFVSPEHIPFVNRRDTLDYNVLAFPTRPNATVEDLLKRLPGIEVDPDGSIKAQGEDVQKVLVEGKEFFGSDPTIATRNLPAQAVDRVQVYDKQSDMAEFTGIPDGEEERVIDLALNDEARDGHFGRLAGGLGADGHSYGVADAEYEPEVRHNETLSLNRFTPTTQLAAVGNINNTNQAGFAGADLKLFQGGGVAARGDGGGPVGGNRQGFTESLAVGVNASRDFGAENWIRSSYFLSSLDNLRNSTVQQQQLLGNQVSSLSDQVTNQTTDNLAHRLDLNAQYTFSEGHDMRFRGGLTSNSSTIENASVQNTQDVDGNILNQAEITNATEGNSLEGNGRLTWRKKLDESGRTLVAEGWGNLSRPDVTSELMSNTGTLDKSGDFRYQEVVQKQTRDGQRFGQGQRLSLTQPFGTGYNLELFGQRRAVDEDENKEVNDIRETGPVFNDLLSSEFERTYTYYQGGLRFNRNKPDSWLVLGLQVQKSNLDGKILDRDEQIENGYTHVLPSLNYRYQFKPGTNLNFNYRATTREPTLTELQPFTDNSNPLSIYVGNPDLTPEYTHSLRGEYRYFDMFSFVNLFTYFNVSYTTDDIVPSRIVDESGLQELSPINSGKSWTATSGVNFGRPIRTIGARTQLDYSITYSKGSEFINQAENESRILGHRVNLSLENRDKELFDIRAGTRFNLNDVEYSLNEELNQDYVTSVYYASGSWYLGEFWTFTSTLNWQRFDEDVFGPGQNVALLNASISRLVMDERVEVELIGFDLLNQNQSVAFNSTASFIQETRVESLGRYVMLRFNYKLGLSAGLPAGRKASPRK